jgi:hypothetical protein
MLVRPGLPSKVAPDSGQGSTSTPAYERSVLPRLLALAMRHRELVPYRQQVGRSASGRVLELT